MLPSTRSELLLLRAQLYGKLVYGHKVLQSKQFDAADHHEQPQQCCTAPVHRGLQQRYGRQWNQQADHRVAWCSGA